MEPIELTLGNISNRLTPDIIDHIFKVKTNSTDDVKCISVTRMGMGEGLISAVYKIHVTGSNYKTSFVAKGLISDLLLRKSIRVCKPMFQREILFFSDILPQLKELQKSLGAKENIQRNIPICYSYHTGDDEDYLLLEDLFESSCYPIAKPTRNDIDATLQVLAHLHAVSMAMRTSKPGLFSKLTNEIKEEIYYNENNREWYAKYLHNAIDIDKQVLKECEDESSVYYKKFLDVVDGDVYGEMIHIASSPGDHPTMNHGDVWFPNFMYSKERSVVFDFQLLRCASPATDLTLYLALCSNLYSSKEDFVQALDTYYNFLQHYLTDMGLNGRKIFSRDDLDEELKKYGKFGLLAGLTTIPLLASDRLDVGKSFKDIYVGVERIPLEDLWKLVPVTDMEPKINLVNIVRIAVDLELI